MIQSSDVEGRLRLFRYGLVVIAVVTFLVSLVAPYVVVSQAGIEGMGVTSFLGAAIVNTVVVAVILVVVYFLYRQYLSRKA